MKVGLYVVLWLHCYACHSVDVVAMWIIVRLRSISSNLSVSKIILTSKIVITDSGMLRFFFLRLCLQHMRNSDVVLW